MSGETIGYTINATWACFSEDDAALSDVRKQISQWVKAASSQIVFTSYPGRPLSFYLRIYMSAFKDNMASLANLYPNSLPLRGLKSQYARLATFLSNYGADPQIPSALISFIRNKSNQAPFLSVIVKVIEILEHQGLYQEQLESVISKVFANPQAIFPKLSKHLFDLFKLENFEDTPETIKIKYNKWIREVLIDLLNETSVSDEIVAKIFEELLSTNCLQLISVPIPMAAERSEVFLIDIPVTMLGVPVALEGIPYDAFYVDRSASAIDLLIKHSVIPIGTSGIPIGTMSGMPQQQRKEPNPVLVRAIQGVPPLVRRGGSFNLLAAANVASRVTAETAGTGLLDQPDRPTSPKGLAFRPQPLMSSNLFNEAAELHGEGNYGASMAPDTPVEVMGLDDLEPFMVAVEGLPAQPLLYMADRPTSDNDASNTSNGIGLQDRYANTY